MQARISPGAVAGRTAVSRILDFDIEARATGYGDPEWVPQEATCIAWSWVGSDAVETRIRLDGSYDMLAVFRARFEQADMVIGHNIRRFDLPVLNAEMLRHKLPPLPAKLSHDTLRDLTRTKGMKRDQENLGKHMRLTTEKMHLAWQDWQDAYAEPDWAGIRSRAAIDVRMHKEMWRKMRREGWLKPPRIWYP